MPGSAKTSVEQSSPGGAGPETRLDLYANLLAGMHAMAQPLTLLESRFYLALSEGLAQPGAQERMIEAAADLQRMGLLFRMLQQLLHLEGVTARSSIAALASVTDGLAQDAEAILAGSALHFDMHIPTVLPLVRVDIARTRQALLELLQVAREVSQPGGRITCIASFQDPWVRLELRLDAGCKATPLEALDESTGLHLALAGAGIRSQQGILELAASPVSMAVFLPLASSPVPDGVPSFDRQQSEVTFEGDCSGFGAGVVSPVHG